MGRYVALIASSLALSAATPASADVVYDAFTSFNGVNAAGGFSWVASTQPTATALTAVDCAINNTVCLGLASASASSYLPGVFKSTGVASTSHPYQPLDRLLVHPGQFAALIGIFTAPVSASYDYSLTFDALTAGTSVFISAFTNATGVVTPLGTAGLLDANSGDRTYSGVVALSAGQIIGFNLGNAGNYSSDSTGLRFSVTQLDPTPGGVPEPAAWAMIIAGFAAIGSTLRRRPAAVFA